MATEANLPPKAPRPRLRPRPPTVASFNRKRPSCQPFPDYLSATGDRGGICCLRRRAASPAQFALVLE
jgi:hypothetical protein